MVEAIRHAQAADDWPTAARMVADSYISLVFDGRLATLRALLQAFPQDAADTDAELALAFAKARLYDGLLEESARYLAVAERRCDAVAGERRPRFDLQLAETRLALARRRGDLSAVVETMRSVETALAAQPTSSLGLGNDLRAAALMNLGIAELWASRTEDARRHLQQALDLARRIGRPYLQLGCLGHLAIAAPLLDRPASVSLELSEQAVALAREHGWTEDPINAAGLGCGAVVLVWLGRFEEAERWLEQARRAVRPEGEPGTELMLHHATGLLSMARGRFDDALTAFAAAKRMQTLLAGEHRLQRRAAQPDPPDAGVARRARRSARDARRDGGRAARPRRSAHRPGHPPPRRGSAAAGGGRARAGHRAPGAGGQGDVGGDRRVAARRPGPRPAR